jgi:hypothetical protein
MAQAPEQSEHDYNTIRPHSGLGNLPPAVYAKRSAPVMQRDGTLRYSGGSAPHPVASLTNHGSNVQWSEDSTYRWMKEGAQVRAKLCRSCQDPPPKSTVPITSKRSPPAPPRRSGPLGVQSLGLLRLLLGRHDLAILIINAKGIGLIFNEAFSGNAFCVCKVARPRRRPDYLSTSEILYRIRHQAILWAAIATELVVELSNTLADLVYAAILCRDFFGSAGIAEAVA